MSKKNLNKIRKSFLENAFPENPLPFKRLNRRAFFALKQKKRKSLTNRIKRVEGLIVKREIYLKSREQSLVTVSSVKRESFFGTGKNQQEKSKGVTRKISKPFFVTSKPIFSLEQLFASFYKNQSKSKKVSSFKRVLQERKKLSLIYGCLGKKQIQKYADRAKRFDGKFDENFIKIVESRLDIALFRICFFPTVLSAKQWISHNHVLVNKKRVTLPGYQLKAGDLITVAPEKREILKRKVSSFVAEKIKIRSRHFSLGLNSFYKILKRFYLDIFYRKKDIKKKRGLFVKRGKRGESTKTLQSLSAQRAALSKIFRKIWLPSFLKYRNLFTRGRPLAERVKSLRITSMKPLNLEVCYKNMVAVFLYSPQKVAVPTSVNLYTIMD